MHSTQPPSGRTLAVFHLAELSGPSLSLRRELRWLGENGPVEVVVPGPGRVAQRYGEFAEVTVLGYAALTAGRGASGPLGVVWDLVRDFRTFRRHIRRTRPARVVAVTTMLPSLLLAARAERTPVLVYAAEIVPTRPGLRRRLGGRLLLRATATLAGSILCCSHAVARQFAGRGGRRVEVAYPPIERAEGAGDGDGDGFRRRHGIPDGAPCVAVVGSVSRGRGQDVLLRALPKLAARLPEVRLLVVGAPHPRAADREYDAELRDLVERLGVADRVVWTGFLDPPDDALAAADVVVNPTRREAFGRVAAEALLAGRPVVATRVEGVPEVLRDGVDALLVAPESPEALAAAVLRLLEDRRLAGRLADAGAVRVRREFSADRSRAGFARALAALPAGAARAADPVPA